MAQELRRVFHSIGKRFTNQRQRIWEVFKEKSSGLTVAQAADLLRADGIGHTTVYRVVKEFVELGFLKWVHGADGEHQYVACAGGHCHPLVCRDCGRVQLVDCQGLNTLQKLVSVETGFRVDGHHLEIFGVCPECLRRSPG
ncbi:MAG: transcriptional repressor [Syntrophobacteraceae bacterium]|jgi:Fe2+ or Zn2+ uptake regulation protein|nr:transcriptional repressor [Syntrophobacteraceae bacterium]